MDRRAALLTALALLLFGVLAALVDGGMLRQLDRLLLEISQRPGGPVLDWLMAAISLAATFEVTAVVVLGLVLVTPGSASAWGWRRLLPLVVFVLVTAVEVGGKSLVHQPGPPLSLLRGPRLHGLGLGTPYSFPSGHVTRAALVLGLLALRWRRRPTRAGWPWICAVGLLLVGYGRVYLGEHWPMDVAGGILLGGAGVGICDLAWRAKT